jgi:hypothetical protein
MFGFPPRLVGLLSGFLKLPLATGFSAQSVDSTPSARGRQAITPIQKGEDPQVDSSWRLAGAVVARLLGKKP